MKLLRVTVLLLSLVAFAFSTPGHAAASGSATVFHLHQLAALASFDSFSPDGCVETFAFVAGLQNNGVPEAFGFIGQFDNCTDTRLLDAAGETFNTTFQINNQLTSASLSAIIPLFDDVSGNTFNVSVNATWTGTGPLSHEVINEVFHTKNFVAESHFNAADRDANASGTVSDGVTNFTPSPSVFAFMESSKSGTVTISH